MAISIGVVEDSDEDFMGLQRVARAVDPQITLERWSRAEELLREAQRLPARVSWPDLLFVDLSLPGLDGSALVAELRALIPTRPLPLFILSGSTRSADVDRCYAAGASLYLVKPLGARQLQSAIDLLSAAPRNIVGLRPE